VGLSFVHERCFNMHMDKRTKGFKELFSFNKFEMVVKQCEEQ